MLETKYVIVRKFDVEVSIVFSELLKHSSFERLEPISAGFIQIKDGYVRAFGKSDGLRLPSRPQDHAIIARDLNLKQ